ncbi:MAG TPA: ROK family transcriptional regulator [Symbiobacteriaceae bacterium]|jgi:glucokinase-like ROK family protein
MTIIRAGDRQLIKELNIALALNVIRQHEPISRIEIAEQTGLGRSTITGIINILIKEGLVRESGNADSPAGRKPVLLTFNARALFAIGVKIGPRSASVALVDMSANVCHTLEIPLFPSRGAEDMLAGIKQAIEETIAGGGIAKEKLLGIGLVMPGVVNPATGTAVTSYFLGWADFPIRDLLEKELEVPVYVDNDANAMALAEALYGAGRGAPDLLALTVGVGIGAGVIINGQIHRGARFSAGELGHNCVMRDGPPCACGRNGCLEALAGDAAVVRRAREEVAAGRSDQLRAMVQGHPDLITREAVVEAAKEGDEAARAVLAESGRWLGIAVGNAINLLSPSQIVVGGEAVLQAGDLILGPMRETLSAVVFPSMPDDLKVVPAALGSNAWVLGAAALVLADVFQVPLHEDNTLAMARRVGQPS